MVNSTPLSHYLLNFVLYTMGAIALIYAAYGYARRRFGLGAAPPLPAAVEPEAPEKPAAASPSASGTELVMESVLNLEEHKTLYVVRAGQERFLIGVGDEDVQCLARLKSTASKSEAPAKTPWYTEPPPAPVIAPPSVPANNFSQNLVHSLRWLVTSRASKK